MKKLFLVFFVLLGAFPAFSRPSNTIFNKEHINVSVHSRYQYMLDWLDTHPSDSSWWSNAYNYPSLSLGFSYDNADFMKTKPGTNMGDFYNLYLATEFDFFRVGIGMRAHYLDRSYCIEYGAGITF